MRHRTEEGIEELRYFVRAARTPVGFNEFDNVTTYEEIKLKRVTEIQN
jgi:hypothetical protein